MPVEPKTPDDTRQLLGVRIPMRDGVELVADLHFPPAGPEGGPYPVILTRDPYGRQIAAPTYRAPYFTEHGYVMVHQDARGSGDSGGDFYPFLREGPDGYDTIEWIAEQPWATGRVGMMGSSYAGWTQWAAARERPPHLTALASSSAVAQWLEEIPWDNGGLHLVMFSGLCMMGRRDPEPPSKVDWGSVYRHLPLRTLDKAVGREIPGWEDWIGHHTLDDFWKSARLGDVFPDLDIPALHVTGWFDGDLAGQMYLWEGMRTSKSAAEQRLVIGPWWHGAVLFPSPQLKDMDFTPESVIDMNQLHLNWFDRWLKDDASAPGVEPPVRYFYTGINEWREAQTWPPPGRVDTSYYFHSMGGANTALGDGRLSTDPPPEGEPSDVYVYDPASLDELADRDFFGEIAEELTGPADETKDHLREDTLVYTSDPLEEPVAVSGRPILVLHASSDCPDTDWVVSITDVLPSGTTVPLTTPYEGRLRARFREGLDKEVFMEPGEIYEFRLDFGEVGHVFRAGHRIRITVKSWDFPVFARNLNTDESIADGIEMRVATNRVHHTPAAPSRLILPVDPE